MRLTLLALVVIIASSAQFPSVFWANASHPAAPPAAVAAQVDWL